MKKAGNSLLFQSIHSAIVSGRGNAFCLRHVGDACHVGDGSVFPVLIWIRNNWVGASQSHARQPIRTSVSESKEAVYKPMRGASRGVEQTKTKGYQQGCSRLINWFHLRCLAPWMNHLPPVWQSTLSFTFLNESWCVGSWQVISIKIWLYSMFSNIAQVLPIVLHSNSFTLTEIAKYLVLSYSIDVVSTLSYS